jgi:drug/metabolite transporter superfamily protein YnfA
MSTSEYPKKAFEDSIKAILTTFGVFTGFAIKAAIDEIDFKSSAEVFAEDLFICVATVALLLRFIVGSAVHLNLCYVAEPRSKKPVMLFKDLVFLVLFGLCAVFMIDADDVRAFALRAGLFIVVGLIWSVLDWLFRRGQTDPGEQTLFSGPWMLIDIALLVWIFLILWVFEIDNEGWQSFLLAAGFAVALYGDMKVVLTSPPKVAVLPGKLP